MSLSPSQHSEFQLLPSLATYVCMSVVLLCTCWLAQGMPNQVPCYPMLIYYTMYVRTTTYSCNRCTSAIAGFNPLSTRLAAHVTPPMLPVASHLHPCNTLYYVLVCMHTVQIVPFFWCIHIYIGMYVYCCVRTLQSPVYVSGCPSNRFYIAYSNT